MKEKIKPLYLQLQGILSQTPLFENPFSTFDTSEIWENYNKTVDKLNLISGKNYDEFKIEPKWERWQGDSTQQVNGTLFRQKINGLINFLHGEYFQDERAPFSGEPQNIFTQNQQVEQTTSIEVLMMTVLEIQEKLIKKEVDYPQDSAENKFIKSIKDSLKTVKNNMDMINLILQTAASVGLTIEKLSKIFS